MNEPKYLKSSTKSFQFYQRRSRDDPGRRSFAVVSVYFPYNLLDRPVSSHPSETTRNDPKRPETTIWKPAFWADLAVNRFVLLFVSKSVQE